jgi:Suppressor of fused protein (SUFU)
MLEKTPDGSNVLRHESRRDSGVPAADDPMLAAHIEAWMRAMVGEASTVLHEIESRFVHIDVHLIPPAPAHDSLVLFTTGMSALPMTFPPPSCTCEIPDRAELVMGLPRDWFTDADVACGGRVSAKRYWPIRIMKQLARLPHECATWLDIGHTVPNGDPPKRWTRERQFKGAILLPPVGILDGRSRIHAPDHTVELLSPFPIYEDEMDFKLTHGLDALLDRFDRHGVTAVFDPGRRSVVR